VGKFFEAIQRENAGQRPRLAHRAKTADPSGQERRYGEITVDASPAASFDLSAKLTNSAAIRRLSERLAPAANVGSQARVMLAACRPGDGCSTIAGALAIDLSQRFKLPTLLVDAHIARPGLHRLFPSQEGSVLELVSGAQGLVRPTAFPRLRLISTWRPGTDLGPVSFEAFEALLSTSPIVIADLGVIRLDARTLALARPCDPVLLVARYGHTELGDIVDTALALRSANRVVGGLVLNGARNPVPKFIRRILQLGRLG
jgi:Mrp family chromosome partitioning ATPase